MNAYTKPAHWSNPNNKLFPFQVGLTCPPHDWDAAPSDFLRMAPPTVGVHGRMLHVPDYEHRLDQRKQNFDLLEEFVQCMANNGADACGQVGSNWVHASGLGVEGIRQHCDMLSDKYETPFHMAGYAMVEALRDQGLEKVALNAAYHHPSRWQGTGGVGSALIQLAKRRGATVIALASEDKHAQIADLSPDVILPRTPESLAEALKEATGHNTVTVVADVVGGAYFPTLIETLDRGGRYVSSGAIAGPIVSLDLRTLYLRDLIFFGSTIVDPNVFTDLIGYIERGEIRPLLAKIYPLREFHQAQEAFISKQHVGNIVVCP